MNVKNTMVEMVLCSCILHVMIRQKKPSEKENIVCVGEVIITVAIYHKEKIKTTPTCLMDSVLCLTLSLMVTAGDAVCNTQTHTRHSQFSSTSCGMMTDAIELC